MHRIVPAVVYFRKTTLNHKDAQFSELRIGCQNEEATEERQNKLSIPSPTQGRLFGIPHISGTESYEMYALVHYCTHTYMSKTISRFKSV